MELRIKPYSIHELGQRENQEDSLFPAFGRSTANDRLFILCDGMGGHAKGEVASATVCEVMSNYILSRWSPKEPFADELFLEALSAAYDALDSKDNGEEKKMGTTLTFVCLHSGGATIAHIGDSRVYQIRPATKEFAASIVFKTRDHSLVNDLIKIGEITEEEAKNHPQKNVITRAMQPCQERRAKADIAHLSDIQAGDYFYMCSDGMLEETSDVNLLNMIGNSPMKDAEKIQMLINTTSENKDNHTAHLIKIEKVKGAQKSQMVTTFPENKAKTFVPNGILMGKLPNKLSLYAMVAVAVLFAIAAIGYIFLTGEPEKKNDSDNENVEIRHQPSSDEPNSSPNPKTTASPKINVAPSSMQKAKVSPVKVSEKPTPKESVEDEKPSPKGELSDATKKKVESIVNSASKTE